MQGGNYKKNATTAGMNGEQVRCTKSISLGNETTINYLRIFYHYL